MGHRARMAARQPCPINHKALPKRDKSKQEHRKALSYTEVADCITAVQASRAGLSTKLVFEFLVLTATRSGEGRGALSAEIDLGTRSYTDYCSHRGSVGHSGQPNEGQARPSRTAIDAGR